MRTLKLSVQIKLTQTDDETYDAAVRVSAPGLEPVEFNEELVFVDNEGFVEALRSSELVQSAVDHLLLQGDICAGSAS